MSLGITNLGTTTKTLHFGHTPGLRIGHLLLFPYLFLTMYFFGWNAYVLILGSIAIAGLVVFSLCMAKTRHITIDTEKQLVIQERKLWGKLTTNKRQAAFSEFSAVRYHTYILITYCDDGREIPYSHLGLYLRHGENDMWRLGDTGRSLNEPKYYRNIAVTVAQMMKLPLEDSDDEPWAYKPKIKRTTHSD